MYSGDFDKTDDTNIQFRGGQNIVLGAKDGDVGLPLETSKLKNLLKLIIMQFMIKLLMVL